MLNSFLGMLVRCCSCYDDLNQGDFGPVVQLDRDGLHDLNLQESMMH